MTELIMNARKARETIPGIISSLKSRLDMDEGPPWNRDAFQCLVGTVLSARTRDENTSRAARALFGRYPDARSLAGAPVRDIERLIRPSGFYRVKARRIKELAGLLLRKHGGKVPEDMDELVRLPGVGRKTAGCVMVYSFRKPQIPVDVHVHRISNRIGLVKTRTPEQTESELMRVVPRRYWTTLNHLFVRFGQQLCRPLRPECWRCPVVRVCEYPGGNLDGGGI
jgi:endonuclease-3